MTKPIRIRSFRIAALLGSVLAVGSAGSALAHGDTAYGDLDAEAAALAFQTRIDAPETATPARVVAAWFPAADLDAEAAALAGEAPLTPPPAVLAARAERAAALAFARDTRAGIEALIAAGWDAADRDGQRDRAAIAEFYSAREFAPVFLDAGAINARGQAVLETLAAAAREGLDPEAYDAPETARIAAEATDAAATELRLARAALHYARDAYTGRIAPGDVASDITIERHIANPVEILATLADAPDAGATLLAYNPPHEGYRLLRDALARLRHDAEDEHHVEVPAGSTLRLGDVDSRVALLRERLGVAMPENAPPGIGAAEPAFDPERFDEALEQAVKTFQDEHGLAADGIVGPATLASLNAGAGDLIPEVIANMERWRWLPRDLGRFHVFVNVPEYRVFVVRGGETVHTTRVIVGQRQHRTPIFSDEMEHIVVNPYWHVPTSILTNEMLPRIQADPTYLSRANYEVVARVGGRSQVVDPTAIDWSTVRRGQVYVRQRPGGGNALGQIKFMFPNQHSVYLHDTSSRGLFTRDRRALSHGCVRVENPFEFADVILSEERQWTPARVRGLVGGSERTIALDSHLPVHLAYFTARVDDEGRLRMFDDIYGHNARTRQLLGL